MAESGARWEWPRTEGGKDGGGGSPKRVSSRSATLGTNMYTCNTNTNTHTQTHGIHLYSEPSTSPCILHLHVILQVGAANMGDQTVNTHTHTHTHIHTHTQREKQEEQYKWHARPPDKCHLPVNSQRATFRAHFKEIAELAVAVHHTLHQTRPDTAWSKPTQGEVLTRNRCGPESQAQNHYRIHNLQALILDCVLLGLMTDSQNCNESFTLFFTWWIVLDF